MSAASSSDELRAQLCESQAILDYAAARLQTLGARPAQVLDVGCGLGGGALYWAQKFKARVLAVTNVKAHVPLVRRFAEAAQAQEQLEVVACDACEVRGNERFDLITSVESSCYLPRRAWLEHCRRLLAPRGIVVILDCCAQTLELERAFNDYWKTRVGTVDEYRLAAESAGLEIVWDEISRRGWRHSGR